MQSEDISRLYSPRMAYYRHTYRESRRWNGVESLEGKKVIIYCEQGFGDILQFARYFPLISKMAHEVVLHCPHTLHRLFKECLDGTYSYLDRDNSEIPQHDYHIVSMSLPFLLNIRDVNVPYLKVLDDANKLVHEAVGESTYNIGIAWEGNPAHSDNSERSCPLKYFAELFKLKSVKLFSLQNAIHTQSLITDCENFELYGATLHDFKDTADLINSMDMVVSVDTAVLHLAGAMGKRGIGMLSHRHDARWRVAQWYPSLQLVSQPKHNDWPNQLEHVRKLINTERLFS